jgi:hypothetical protein
MDHSPFELRLNPPGIGDGSLGLYKVLGFSEAEIRDLARKASSSCPARKGRRRDDQHHRMWFQEVMLK